MVGNGPARGSLFAQWHPPALLDAAASETGKRVLQVAGGRSRRIFVRGVERRRRPSQVRNESLVIIGHISFDISHIFLIYHLRGCAFIEDKSEMTKSNQKMRN